MARSPLRPPSRPSPGSARKPEPPAAADTPLDAAVRLKDPQRAPEEHRDAVRAVLKAFAEYAEGRDDSAREALNAVGMKSPLLDWKLLLRGLIAYSTSDDARALDNWTRLDAVRLPARLALPFRLRLDPAFGATLGPTAASTARTNVLKLEGDAVAQRFAELQQTLGRDQPMTKAFAAVERLVPLLRTNRPDLIPRLAKVVYWAVQRFGEPTDVPKYVRILGKPPDDPDFHRLNAMNYERGSPAEAVAYWLKYEKWLAGSPAGVAPATAKQVRVLVLRQVGRITELLATKNLAGFGSPAFDDIFAQMFGGKGPKIHAAVRQVPAESPTVFWKRALALDPANELVATDLIDYHQDRDEIAQATAAAAEFLTHAPHSLAVLNKAVVLALMARDPAAALARLQQAHALNPLDAEIRAKMGLAYFGVVRQALAAAKPAEALARLDAAREFGGPKAAEQVARAVLALKANDAAAAKAHEEAAFADPKEAFSVGLMFAADAALAKLKPALKKPFDVRLAAIFTAPLPPGTGVAAAVGMLRTASLYLLSGQAYRGQPTHLKKIHDLLLKTVQADADSPAAEFAVACAHLKAGRFVKELEKFADALSKRFVTDPFFPLYAAEAVWGQATAAHRPPAYRKLDAYARKAERLARNKTPEVRRQVAERLQAIDGTNGLDDDGDF